MASEFSKTKSALTRAANKIAVGAGITLRGKIDFPGSFASFRIDDVDGVVTMKQASSIRWALSQLLVDNGIAIDVTTGNPGYHMGGVVFTWLRK